MLETSICETEGLDKVKNRFVPFPDVWQVERRLKLQDFLSWFPFSAILIYSLMSTLHSRAVVSCVNSTSSTWTMKKKKILSEQKQVSPLNRRLSDLSVRLNLPVQSEHDIKQNNGLH